MCYVQTLERSGHLEGRNLLTRWHTAAECTDRVEPTDRGLAQVSDQNGSFNSVSVLGRYARRSLFGKRIESLLLGTGPCAISDFEEW